MRRRVWTWTAIAVLLLSCATLGTARATQIVNGNSARARSSAGQMRARAAIQRATSEGIALREMSGLTSRLDVLAARRAPSTSPLWDTESAHFYDSQARAYAHLMVQTQRRIRALELDAHTRAIAATTSLRQTIDHASLLRIDVTSAHKFLSTSANDPVPMQSVSQERSIASRARSEVSNLSGPINERERYIRDVTLRTGGTIGGVVTLADHEANDAGAQLDLLGLLTTRASSYRTALGALDLAVHKESSLTGAVLSESALHSKVAAMHADFVRTLPAKMIVISTENQIATMYQGTRIVYSTNVTTGGPELPTDHGVFHIYFKASPFLFHSPWPVGSPYYYDPTPVQYWMPFDGGEGLHDASWRSNFGPGSNLLTTDLGNGNAILGTHGCVNLPLDAAQFVWDWAPVGTTVVVV